MKGRRPVAAVASVAILLAAACGGQAEPTGAQTTRPTTGAPATEQLSAAPGTPATTASLLEGTFRTAPLPVENVLASVEASGLSSDNLRAYLGDHKTVIYSLRFLGGRMAWFERLDDGPDEVGVDGPFTIKDGRTIIFPDTSGPGIVSVDFTLDGSMLTTHAPPEAQTTANREDPVALAAVAAWFNTAAYQRVAP